MDATARIFSSLPLVRSVVCSLLVVGATSVNAEATWHAVRSTDLRPLFVEQELADGTHFAYQFHGSGVFTGIEMGRDVRGKWRSVDGEFCWTWLKPAGAEECFTVEQNKNDVRLLRDGAQFLDGTLTPLKQGDNKKRLP